MFFNAAASSYYALRISEPMKKKNYKDFGDRLKEIREKLNFSQEKMAGYFDFGRTAYTKNEKGYTFPHFSMLVTLVNVFNVSLNWLIGNVGGMFIGEEKKESKEGDTNNEDLKDLLYHMRNVPLVYYSIMDHFQKFKIDNKEVIDQALIEIKDKE